MENQWKSRHFQTERAALEAVLEKLRLEEFETAAVIEMTQERCKEKCRLSERADGRAWHGYRESFFSGRP